MLTSNILKGVTKGFPLKINAIKVENVSVDYNRDFIVRILPRIEYDALRAGVKDVSFHLKQKNLLGNLVFVAWCE
jgi:multifunctional methyltransferase subunit TRM112